MDEIAHSGAAAETSAALQDAAARDLARRIQEAPTVLKQSQLLWALPALERHAALGQLGAEIVATIIEHNPEENLALLGNMPPAKFSEIINLGGSEQGRLWLERAVTSGHLAAQMLPALMNPRDLAHMIMTSADVRRSLPRLLNYTRATEMRTLLHPLEWKNSLDDLLLADAEELLRKAPIKNRALTAVMQALIDFFPEIYLETIRIALEMDKYTEDRPDEQADLVETPFALPEMLLNDPSSLPATPEQPASQGANASAARQQSVTDIIPAASDPFLTMATSKLSESRRAELEAQLKVLLRQEIVATGSFAQAEILRAAGRLVFQLRVGLEQLGASDADVAGRILEDRSLTDVSQIGARVAERYRQRSLKLAGLKDWLDRAQKQFLTAMSKPEPGLDREHSAPVFYLATRPGQSREEWSPTPLVEIDRQLDLIEGWAGLARAAFTSAARVQTIFASNKTKSAEEALRRIVIALCLYRRWEPELVRPGEDYVPFRKQFADDLGRLNSARQVVLEALDVTPAGACDQARRLLLDAVSQLEARPKLNR
jgi:hypothetical protein